MVTWDTGQEGAKNRWTIFDAAQEIVDKKFEDGMGYATDAFRIASETMQNLSNLSDKLRRIDIDIPIEDITPPDIDDFVATIPDTPTIEVNMPADLDEADEVSAAVKDKLLNDIVSGGPAIPESVETAIFDRESERSLIIHQEELDKISAEWSKRGFILPDGMLAFLITQSEIEYANKRQDISRDVAIKSFELGDSNTKFAIQQGIVWYGQKVEVYKAKIQAEIGRIDAIVKAFLGEVEIYKGSAQVYTALADTKIKKFDAQIRLVVTRAELLIKDAEIDMKNYEVLNTLKIESMKGVASIAAQLVAGALSSVSASASIQASNSAGYAYKAPASIEEVITP